MELQRIIKHLKEDNNCYVEELPAIKELEKEVGFEIAVRNTQDSKGYILYKKTKEIKEE